MRRQSNTTNKRLKNLINNSILKTILDNGFEIEFILYFYQDEKISNNRGGDQ